MKSKIFFLTILFITFFSMAEKSWAATYWVSPTGAAANLAACSGATPLSGTSACSYDKANGSGVVAGDTVYYRAGTYSGITGSVINPSNTGTFGNVITFSAYNEETVTFNGSGLSSKAIDLNSDYNTIRSYIKVNGLKFYNFAKHLWILKGTNNEISYCTFEGNPTEATSSNDLEWSGSYIYRQAQYNWIHHNTFKTWGWCQPFGTDYGAVFQVGLEEDNTDHTMYNLVENNDMSQGGHHVFSYNGVNNVYRNNYIHNEPWCDDSGTLFSARVGFQTGGGGDGQYNLSEGNRIGYGGPKNKDEIGGSGGSIAGANNIWRHNTWFQVYTPAMWVTWYPNAAGNSDVVYNKIYNNTYWHGGYGRYQYHPSGTAPSENWDDSYTHAIDIDESVYVYDNVFKNNLFYQNSNLFGTSKSIVAHGGGTPASQLISNNWLDNAGDPKFMDIAGTPDPTNGTQWDFNLQSSSPAIDGGAYLTTANGSGVGSTSLSVQAHDAGYFFDGWGIKAGIPNANISADWIAIGTISNVVQISSINYATDTITLASPITWSNNAPVWLFKQSDGSQVLYGSAPDYGAYEYVSGADVTAPAAPSGLSVQ
jgi:hypothetical protein